MLWSWLVSHKKNDFSLHNPYYHHRRYDKFCAELKSVAEKNGAQDDDDWKGLYTKRLYHGTRALPPMKLVQSGECAW